MQVREKAGQTLTEPLSLDDVKTYLGITETDQDVLIETFITAARKWVEKNTSRSVI